MSDVNYATRQIRNTFASTTLIATCDVHVVIQEVVIVLLRWRRHLERFVR